MSGSPVHGRSVLRRARPFRWAIALILGALVLVTTVVPAPEDRAEAIPDDPRVLAQALLDGRAAGRFDSISWGVVDALIAPVARGETPAAGCRIDVRVFQVLVQIMEHFGSLVISDLARSCPGASQDPPCPTTYVSPHCADPARAIDFVRAGGTVLRGGSESLPFLRYLDSFVPRGTLAGQSQCGSNVAFEYITSRIEDACNHIHLALPATGILRLPSEPTRSTDGVLSRVAIGSPDFDGDGFADVFRVTSDGLLYLHGGDGRGSWKPSSNLIGSGWNAFSLVLAPGDFGGDDRSDLIGLGTDGIMRLYDGNGTGGWASGSGRQIGSSWNLFRFVIAPGDFTGDGNVDVIGIRPDGVMLLYAGNGAGGWLTGWGTPIGSGWGRFSKVLAPGDFTGDGKVDVLGVDGGTLRLYSGNGASGWSDPNGRVVGTSWDQFIVITGPGDFSGDAAVDLLAVRADGVMLMYRGDRAGGWVTGQGEVIGSEWW